ncbi:cell division protein ZapE [Monaibacterium marinum]|uniref:Cell division protein ZapE n=1 Tax=Pontivivens marinum TaxID=1690039 RepID=A0A2C9CN87_9RHOB|nr:cell division protein ZapE [Monaibacterium marinum]SOH92660.1 cell division protein ZapE [Monaibacterium marinum]
MTDGPLPRYRALIADGTLEADPAQRLAVEKLQLLHTRLNGYDPTAGRKVRLGLFGWGRERVREADIPGLYLYGGVGRGKSMLMDLFFDTAPVAAKQRVHFHAFMQDVHDRIGDARKAGREDPVEPVAEAIAQGATLLCFDEMQITDITDAMLVGRLFEKLFERGTIVVATSNRHPDELYKNGLNRQLFVPFIAQIKARMEVHHLESTTDHRLGRLSGRDVYFTGADAAARMDDLWHDLAGGDGAPLKIARKGREIVIPRYRNGVGRGDFAAFCKLPLGPGDYLEIAKAVRTLMIDDVPMLRREAANEAKRFVTLIDALYEAKVGLVMSAAAEPDALYEEGDGAFEFQRTASRLHEMASDSWGS